MCVIEINLRHLRFISQMIFPTVCFLSCVLPFSPVPKSMAIQLFNSGLLTIRTFIELPVNMLCHSHVQVT